LSDSWAPTRTLYLRCISFLIYVSVEGYLKISFDCREFSVHLQFSVHLIIRDDP